MAAINTEQYEKVVQNLEYELSFKDSSHVIRTIDTLSREFFDPPEGLCFRSPLHVAAELGKVEIVDYLLSKKQANPNVQDACGWTPLEVAARDGHLDIVKALLGAGANPNLQDATGWTPLQSAVNLGHLDIVQTLLDAGANPNLKDNAGWTSLRIAIQHRYEPHFIEVLLRGGADPFLRDPDGRTSFGLARDCFKKDSPTWQVVYQYSRAKLQGSLAEAGVLRSADIEQIVVDYALGEKAIQKRKASSDA